MKKLILSLSVMLIATGAFAANDKPVKVKLNANSLVSGYVHGFGRITISQEQDGMLLVERDRNKCNQMGCTRMGTVSEVLRAELIEDKRSVDGDLLLNLRSKLHSNRTFLKISSGFNLDNMITYTVIENPGPNETQVAMTPQVWVEVK